MTIFTKSRLEKSRFDRLREAFNDSLNAPNAMSGGSTLRRVANVANEKPARPSLRRVAIGAGAFLGLTAASAGISSLRRREEARGNS
jgi:hypothetical protein